MSNTNIELMDFFSRALFEEYEVPPSMARYLFSRWHISKFEDKEEIRNFVKNEDVKKVFFIKPGINIVKKYSQKELNNLGLVLSEIDALNHLYKDNKYNFLWQEVYHGISESWLGVYTIKDPDPDDKHLL